MQLQCSVLIALCFVCGAHTFQVLALSSESSHTGSSGSGTHSFSSSSGSQIALSSMRLNIQYSYIHIKLLHAYCVYA
jgi:hypothetical protein